jgi:hypothetical protein
MIRIVQHSANEQWGTANFCLDEQGQEAKGELMFRIRGSGPARTLDVLDPFGGQNPKAYSTLSSLLRFQLEQEGHL